MINVKMVSFAKRPCMYNSWFIIIYYNVYKYSRKSKYTLKCRKIYFTAYYTVTASTRILLIESCLIYGLYSIYDSFY